MTDHQYQWICNRLSEIMGRLPAKEKDSSPSDAADCSPVAWMHVLDTTEGIPENEPWKILSFDEKHPFGEPGRDYSAEYGPPVSTPLYFRENDSDDESPRNEA